MLINNIFYTLNSFNKNDWVDFGKFVNSPYFVRGNIYQNIHKRLYILFNNKRRKKTLSLERFQEHILRIKELNGVAKQTLNNRLSNFFKTIEKYLIYRNKNELQQKSDLLNEYLNRNASDNFRRCFVQFKKSLNKKYIFSDEYQYIQEIYSLESSYQLSQKNTTVSFNAFSEQTKYFVANFIENLFHYTLNLFFEEFYGNNTDKNICKILFENINIEKLIEVIKSLDSEIYVKLLIRYNLLKLFYEKNWKQYHDEVVKLFFGNEFRFTKTFRLSVYNYLESYYTMQINKGNADFIKIMFTLMKRREKHNLIVDFSKGLFSMNIFNNFITIGLKVNELNWVEKFIDKNYINLPEDIKENEYNINKARLYFQKKEYKNALSFLEKADNTIYDKYHFLQSRLRLQIYYELSMIEDAYSEIDKFRHKIRNSKITPQEAKNFAMDYISLYLTLLKIKTNINKGEINDIFLKINNLKNFISKDWFLEKISEFNNTL